MALVPVFAFANKESDAHELIKDARCGYSIISDDQVYMFNTIGRMYRERDRLIEYGKMVLNMSQSISPRKYVLIILKNYSKRMECFLDKEFLKVCKYFSKIKFALVGGDALLVIVAFAHH